MKVLRSLVLLCLFCLVTLSLLQSAALIGARLYFGCWLSYNSLGIRDRSIVLSGLTLQPPDADSSIYIEELRLLAWGGPWIQLRNGETSIDVSSRLCCGRKIDPGTWRILRLIGKDPLPNWTLDSGQISFDARREGEWKLSWFEGKNLQWSRNEQRIACGLLLAHLFPDGNQDFSFLGGSFHFGDLISGSGWNGRVAMHHQRFFLSSCTGQFLSIPTKCQLRGSPASWIVTGNSQAEHLNFSWESSGEYGEALYVQGALQIPLLSNPIMISGTKESGLWECSLEGNPMTLSLQQSSPEAWHFDLETSDFFRCAGSWINGALRSDDRSHFLGAPCFLKADFQNGSLEQASFQTTLGAGQKLWAQTLAPELSIPDEIELHLSHPTPSIWKMEQCRLTPFNFSCSVEGTAVTAGSFASDTMPCQGKFEGRIDLKNQKVFARLFEVSAEIPLLTSSGSWSSPLSWDIELQVEPVEIAVGPLSLCSGPPLTIAWPAGSTPSVSNATIRVHSEQFPLLGTIQQIHYTNGAWQFQNISGVPLLPQLDLECAINQGQLHCTMHTPYPIALTLSEDLCHLTGEILYEDCPLQIACEFYEDHGSLQIREARAAESGLLAIWEDGALRSIEGSCCGLSAFFYAESPTVLVGEMEFDFTRLEGLLPVPIPHVLDSLEIGRGYCCKGELHCDPYPQRFSGLLTGKEIDLFGYQLKTLFAQIEFDSNGLSLADVKVSDRAGTLDIPVIQVLQEKSEPWSLHIPQLIVRELRPSLLKVAGEPEDPLSPLVVREFTMNHLRGYLDDSNSYTASGELRFLNSFKRSRSLLDLPAALLGRLFGFDLELLIPVQGTVDYQLKNGFFYLTDLRDSFSDGNRSQFFLPQSETYAPRMDLDLNLDILVQMKHYVLFTITEHFLISIDGTLHDPRFHLKKNRL